MPPIRPMVFMRAPRNAAAISPRRRRAVQGRRGGFGPRLSDSPRPRHCRTMRVGPRKIRMKFEGTDRYVASDELKLAVNAAVALERPLLIKGEPGTGKTLLAEEVARALGAPLFTWHIKSTTKAHQGLYEYDAVSRLRDSQLGDARVADVRNYI